MYLINSIFTLALASDMSTGRIPNHLFVIGMISAQIWAVVNHSVGWALIQLLSGGLLIVLLFPLFMIGCIGAGDVKLMAILPSFFGLQTGLRIIILSFIIAAVIGAIKLLFGHILLDQLISFIFYLKSVYQTKTITKYDKPSVRGCNIADNQIHFSLPLFIGVMTYLGGIINL